MRTGVGPQVDRLRNRPCVHVDDRERVPRQLRSIDAHDSPLPVGGDRGLVRTITDRERGDRARRQLDDRSARRLLVGDQQPASPRLRGNRRSGRQKNSNSKTAHDSAGSLWGTVSGNRRMTTTFHRTVAAYRDGAKTLPGESYTSPEVLADE